MKFTLLVISLIMFCTLALADAEPFIQGQPADIRLSGRVNGAPSSTMTCNITVLDRFNNVLVSYQAMSYDSASKTYNYTLPSSNTSAIDYFCTDITCMDTTSGLNDTESYCYPVNNAGKDYSIEEALTYIIILIIVGGLFGLCLYGAIKIPYENPRGEWGQVTGINYKKYGKIFCIAMVYVFMIWIFYIGWNMSYAFLQMQFLSTFFQALFTLLMRVAIPLMALFLVFGIILYIKERKMLEMIHRGLMVR